MKAFAIILFCASAALAQPASQPNVIRYQPTYDDVRQALGLSDEQVTQLKQMQQDKVNATQAFYNSMAEKQKELNALLESNSTDAPRIGQIMIDLQQMRRQPPPTMSDIHDRALALLSGEQRMRLATLEKAMKLRAAIDQATQFALLVQPPPTPPVARPVPAPGTVEPLKSTPKK